MRLTKILLPAVFLVPAAHAVAQDACSPGDIERRVANMAVKDPVLPAKPPVEVVRKDELPPLIRKMEEGGARIEPLPVTAGMRGFLVTKNDRFQVFYGAPDGQHILAGTLFGPDGTEVTVEQAKKTSMGHLLAPGPRQAAATAAAPAAPRALTDNVFKDVQNSSWVSLGKQGAPVLYLIVDPHCHYSKVAVEGLKDAIGAGKIELRLIPVAVMKEESLPAGSSLLVSRNPIGDWMSGKLSPNGDVDAIPAVQDNNQLFVALHRYYREKGVERFGTPIYVGMNEAGGPTVEIGVPNDLAGYLAKLR